MNEYKIEKDEVNIRIDKIVGKIREDISRTAIQRMIEEGNVLVNDRIVKSSYKVADGDIITIQEEEPVEIDLIPQDIPINIVYQDDDILIVNKEKGMCVHPGARKSKWNIGQCYNGNMQRQPFWNRWQNSPRSSA